MSLNKCEGSTYYSPEDIMVNYTDASWNPQETVWGRGWGEREAITISADVEKNKIMEMRGLGGEERKGVKMFLVAGTACVQARRQDKNIEKLK